MKEDEKILRSRVSPFIALGVGVLLWFVPTLLLPVLSEPIDFLLRSIGLLAPSAGAFEGNFTSALILRWVAVILLLIFVLKVERLPLVSVGVRRPKWSDLFLAVGVGLVALIITVVIHVLLIGPQPDTQTQTGQIITTLSFLGKIHLILNAAIVEELFYRGFLIERVATITHRVWVGGIISFVLFVVGHISGSGLTQALTYVAFGTLVFVSLYLWRRNLFLCIVAHATSNLLLLASGT